MSSPRDETRSGADSIFAFIRRTAEHDGPRCRWKTADYGNRLHYGISLLNGGGGIPLFLQDYGRLRDNAEALDLARKALEWCADPGHGGPVRGLHVGKAGPAFAALSLDADLRTPAISNLCEEVIASILREDPGPVTDMIGGASSNGFYLLRAAEAMKNTAYFAGALRCGDWIRGHLTRDELGCHCLVRPDGQGFGNRPYSGFAHGISGIAFFFALLFEASRDAVWKDIALEIFDTLVAHAQPIHGGWNWSPLLGGTELSRCQWSHGAAGIGLAFLAASTIIGEPRLLHAAIMAGEATYRYGDFRKNPTQCVGVAGGGDLLLELWNVTHEECWLKRAQEFGEAILTYRTILPEGDAWPTDEPGLFSADFMYGAAGTGHFLLRLETEGQLPMPLM
jgi:lantibiotic modifying enzyme